MGTFTIENFLTLGMLILLQAVLGFDNLLYISLESRKAPAEKQKYVSRIGIGLAIILRVLLMFVLVKVMALFQEPFFKIEWSGYISGKFNLYSLIVLGGGGFIIYTAMKSIWQMISLEEHHSVDIKHKKSISSIIFMIVVMNIVFSFDSILSAMALTKVFWVMAAAVVIGGILMMWLTDRVSKFLHKNRMYEVLGLFILFLVGIMLITEGGHIAHLSFFDNEIVPLSKTTFYFVIVFLVATDIIQGKYKKKLLKEKESKEKNVQ